MSKKPFAPQQLSDRQHASQRLHSSGSSVHIPASTPPLVLPQRNGSVPPSCVQCVDSQPCPCVHTHFGVFSSSCADCEGFSAVAGRIRQRWRLPAAQQQRRRRQAEEASQAGVPRLDGAVRPEGAAAASHPGRCALRRAWSVGPGPSPCNTHAALLGGGHHDHGHDHDDHDDDHQHQSISISISISIGISINISVISIISIILSFLVHPHHPVRVGAGTAGRAGAARAERRAGVQDRPKEMMQPYILSTGHLISLVAPRSWTSWSPSATW